MGEAPPPAPETVVVGVKGAWAKGENAARLTIIDFVDYQCPACGRHFRDVLPQIEAGLRAGVRGTPTFFLGWTEANDSPVNVLRGIPGASEYGGFKRLIDSLLPREN
jgi:protein-disulfide isomerase